MTLSVQISKQKVNPKTFNESVVIVANVIQFHKIPEERGSGPRGGNSAESLMSSFSTELVQTVHADRDMNQIN